LRKILVKIWSFWAENFYISNQEIKKKIFKQIKSIIPRKKPIWSKFLLKDTPLSDLRYY